MKLLEARGNFPLSTNTHDCMAALTPHEMEKVLPRALRVYEQTPHRLAPPATLGDAPAVPITREDFRPDGRGFVLRNVLSPSTGILLNNQMDDDPTRDLTFWRFFLRDTGTRDEARSATKKFFKTRADEREADERDEESIVYLLMSLAVMERDWPGALTFSSDLQWRDCSKRLERLRRQEVAQGLRVPADAFVAFALGMRLRGASPLAALLNHDDSCLHRWELNVGWRRQMPLRACLRVCLHHHHLLLVLHLLHLLHAGHLRHGRRRHALRQTHAVRPHAGQRREGRAPRHRPRHRGGRGRPRARVAPLRVAKPARAAQRLANI